MKIKIIFSISVLGVIVASTTFYNAKNFTKISALNFDEVEALTACESIGWRDNDGNCVKNSNTGDYFCKDDTWHEITDCLKPKK